ncbi:MAG: hypothetical protein ABIC19_01225 [Patescibacteria group bacterium]|nr:hypothetical protein [Patescibacteria group bacterium]
MSASQRLKKTYRINNNFLMTSDGPNQSIKSIDSEAKESIRFHVRSNDYFATLATVLDLLRQEQSRINKNHQKLLEKLRDELMFLQQSYRLRSYKGSVAK